MEKKKLGVKEWTLLTLAKTSSDRAFIFRLPVLAIDGPVWSLLLPFAQKSCMIRGRALRARPHSSVATMRDSMKNAGGDGFAVL